LHRGFLIDNQKLFEVTINGDGGTGMKTRGRDMDRREFLRGLGTTAAALGTGAVILQTGSLAQAAAPTKKYGMVIDTNRCIGCHGCTIACKSENNVPEGVFRSWVMQIIKGKYPQVKNHLLPRLCNNCEDAPCLNDCPTGATYRTPEDGVVHVDREKCVGCHTCVLACPYNSRFINPLTGTADKCDFCYHRITKGLLPACVDACTGKARIFGDMNDPQSEVSLYLAKYPVQGLRTYLDTKPKVHYVYADEAILNLDYSYLSRR
jgi:tetrathionate reductase subunit B